MTGYMRDGLIAGLLAAFIWMVISTLTGVSAGAVVGWGFGFLIIGFAGTLLIASLIGRSRGAAARR